MGHTVDSWLKNPFLKTIPGLEFQLVPILESGTPLLRISIHKCIPDENRKAGPPPPEEVF